MGREEKTVLDTAMAGGDVRMPEIDVLWPALCRTVRHGATAAKLAFTPDVVDLLTPAGEPRALRLLQAEGLIRAASHGLEPSQGRAVRLLLGLDGTAGLRLGVRRARAAAVLGISVSTVRAPARQGALMWDLMVEVCRQLAGG